jgi:hypothetical protein
MMCFFILVMSIAYMVFRVYKQSKYLSIFWMKEHEHGLQLMKEKHPNRVALSQKLGGHEVDQDDIEMSKQHKQNSRINKSNVSDIASPE